MWRGCNAKGTVSSLLLLLLNELKNYTFFFFFFLRQWQRGRIKDPWWPFLLCTFFLWIPETKDYWKTANESVNITNLGWNVMWCDVKLTNFLVKQEVKLKDKEDEGWRWKNEKKRKEEEEEEEFCEAEKRKRKAVCCKGNDKEWRVGDTENCEKKEQE